MCLLCHFIDVVVPAECFINVQTQILDGGDILMYLSMNEILGLQLSVKYSNCPG